MTTRYASGPDTRPVTGYDTPARFTSTVRWVAAAAIVVPVALNAVSHFFDPFNLAATDPQMVAAAAAHPTALSLATVLKLLEALGAGGALALAWLARRSARLALIGGAVLFLSYLAEPLNNMDYLVAPSLVGRSPAVIAAMNSVGDGTLINVLFAIGILGNLVGYVLIGSALLRSHAAAPWVGAGLIIAAALNVVVHVAGNPTTAISDLITAVWVLFALVSAGAAHALLRSTSTPGAASTVVADPKVTAPPDDAVVAS